MVKRSQLETGASPFLGLALAVEKLPEARDAFHALSDWRLDVLMQKFGYAVSWAICATLSEHYGEDGNAKVWPLVEETLGRTLKLPEERKLISKAFLRACQKLGLASDGFDRSVQAFQIHAGVSRSQLHHLSRVFIAQERSIGLPDQDDIVLLNRWEDDALHFLDAGVHVLQRPILMDHSAWMASAYVDWRRDQNALQEKSTYLKLFGEQLQKVFDGSNGPATRIAPVPRLVWEDGRPQLSIPGQEQRYKIFLDGQLHRVRAGRLWPLPFPLPAEVTWQGSRPGCIRLFQNTDFVVFDSNTGRQVELTSRVVDEETRFSGVVATAIVVSRESFSVDGEPSRETAPDLYSANVDLRSGKVVLARGSKHWTLYGVRRPQISIYGQPVAKGLGGPNLWGPEAEVELDFGCSELLAGHTDGKQRRAFVRVETPGGSMDMEIEVDGRGIATVTVAAIVEAACLAPNGDPEALSLTLLRTNADSTERVLTRFKRKLIVWPGFRAMEGVLIRSEDPPRNFIDAEARHVVRDDAGFLCLERGGGYVEGRIAFEIGGHLSLFALRAKLLSGVLERVDGTVMPWRLGGVIVKGSATKSDALVLTSPDERAVLRIGSRTIVNPFRERPTYAIPIAILDGGDIVHVSETGAPTLIATVESASMPSDVTIRTWSGGTRISFEMPFNVGGIMVTLQTEDGHRDQSEVSFDRLPAALSCQFWLLDPKVHGRKVEIELNGAPLTGLNLITLKVRSVGEQDWTQLSNARDDVYAFPLIAGTAVEATGSALNELEDWLSRCYAPEVWDGGLGKALQHRWSTLVDQVSLLPGGTERLLLLSLQENEPDWLPMLHVIQEIPTLFAAPSIKFHGFSSSNGADRILRVIADASSRRLRDLDLSPMAMLAFPNARQADMAGEKLRNFRPSSLPVIFSTMAEKPSEWLAKDALGPDHAWTGLNLLRDRIETHEILGAGEAEARMSLRSAEMNRTSFALQEPIILDRCLSTENENDTSVHLIEKALATFAVRSREGAEAVEALIERASKKTGLSKGKILASVGEMIRLGREIFIFHLIAAEIEKRSRP
ncbi:hypothetical protein LOM8899_02755 [Flavimaricola marinus]|uniref:Uncharacterized protein n=2 Tax=Flavimaricola marinus TaxID=1819565 RepID=A0A238LI94_9RHOB|nr:hypothetical protein LOM8899_02755 [Flavimaricola marinus]